MADRDRWDHRYREIAAPRLADVGPPAVFAPYADLFPVGGRALELACGVGTAAVWLARRGLAVRAYDVSPVAIAHAAELARRCDVARRCVFEVADLDLGLPSGDPVDVLLCNRFRDPRLYAPIIARLAEGGMLAISVLSEVGAQPGRFRAEAGELVRAFGTALQPIAADESDGVAWLLARNQ
ncbi:class I SAM-dependent methyltransferase [Mycolicibacterium parafortuitum]|uniref:Type 12 methyltransferase [Pseudonocardia dioxanivorans] n=1 Tax=Mycolicibacterium parafortuitum TaxID=39692 RepID=A0A375YM97_MYCPF|nr:class I SAM-dependent methyltransferase [Mycolicibacterium parafortuitum]ORB29946.1 SAM-dependent methyltransferase [Mycolicibacterium parafortuitum]SRX82169.1 type 12 methyltransferase [Pseudonocardia dioxanivorans] [Mycolicibacterium parafortuitum]